MLSRDPARSRPPTDRPVDIIGLELLVCVTQALLAGLLLTLAADLGGDARAVGLPVPGLLAVLGLAVGAAWVWWLSGGSGWPLAAVDLAIALLTGALWLLSIQDAGAPHIDPLVGLIALVCSIYGIVAGVFLPGPRRAHWKGGPSQPRRGLPETRTTPARFSPPVQKVVDERLANVTLSRASLSTVRLRSIRLPSRATPATDPAGTDPDGSLTAVAPVAMEAGGGAVVAAVATAPAAPATVTIAAAPATADADVSSLIHRILTGDEPLSVSAMRLSGIPSATDDLAADDGRQDEDETLPFPTVGPGHDDLDDGQLDPATDGTARGA